MTGAWVVDYCDVSAEAPNLLDSECIMQLQPVVWLLQAVQRNALKRILKFALADDCVCRQARKRASQLAATSKITSQPAASSRMRAES